MHDLSSHPPEHEPAARAETVSPGTIRRIAIVALIVAVALAAWGILSRRHREAALVERTDAQALRTVSVIHPKPTAGGDPLVLPGNVQAYNSAAVYPRTTGYVRRWFADIGTRVKAGQVLATIDAPEVEQQLAQARADLETARANQALAQSTARRWTSLQKQDAVSQQETDEKLGDLAAKRAVTNAEGANVGRLSALIGFTRIVAPFAGTVTSRAVQVGQLVSAGNAAAQPLFTVSDTSRMRIYVRVPQPYSGQTKPGMHATLTLPEYPGREFDAVLTRSAGAIDQQSGTVLVQLEAPNPDGALKPGAYAQARFPIAGAEGSVTIPSSALVFRSDGNSVAVVDRQGRVTLRKITIGTDRGATLEISAGLKPGDTVIDSPPDSIATGDVVRIAAPQPVEPKRDAKG